MWLDTGWLQIGFNIELFLLRLFVSLFFIYITERN